MDEAAFVARAGRRLRAFAVGRASARSRDAPVRQRRCAARGDGARSSTAPREAEQLALLRAHPELAGKAAVRGELTADSTQEQSGAGLSQCSPEEFALLTDLNRRYNAKFGFPFILAVKGYDRAGIIREFARRVEQDRAAEFAECLAQIARITRFRLEALVAG